MTVNNEAALERILETIRLDPSLPWTETLTVTNPESLEVADVDDDLQRELAFYKQALYGATTAKSLASKHNLPFTRPTDYFAEMVKSDSHMERVRQRLLDESASIKKSEDAQKQRQLKKYGKEVQVEKLKERAKGKKDMEERIKGLKRKRRGMLGGDSRATGGDEDFDIEVENALGERPNKRANVKGAGKPKMPRSQRDARFGFGGKGKRSKQNTRESTNDFEFGGGKNRRAGGKQGGGAGAKARPKQRPGKARRAAARTR
jgi:rRNA-processing protein EBP2